MTVTPVPRPRVFPTRWIVLGVLVLLAIALVRRVPALVIDYLWFGELGYRHVLITTLATQVALKVAFGGAFLALFGGNLLYALRRATPRPAAHPELRLLLPPLELHYPQLRLLAIAGAVGLSLLIGQWAGGWWLAWQKFLHPQPFGATDPVFGHDLSFYVFILPVLRSVAGFVQFTLFAAAVASAGVYVLQGQLWARPGFATMTRRARRHLMLLGAAILAVAAVQTYFSRYELLYSTRGIVAGAGYSDLHASLPALHITIAVTVLAALLVAVEAFRTSLRPAVIAVAAVFASHLLLVQLWPFALQRLVVAPNEIERESPYLAREIAATRFAFALDDVEEGSFPATQTLTAARVAANAATIDNVRLWETEPLRSTNGQLQEIRTYYDFVDVDNDRYRIGGELRQVALSTRELNPEALPARTWINEHLTYTHGYGVCVAPVNQITPEGLPDYFVKDIPPVSSVPELEIRRPEIYFGELAARYTFVNTRALEFDYPSGEDNVYTKYRGEGGVRLGGLMGRLLFATHFGEPKIVLSGDLTPDSRILLHRNVRERVTKLAPFLAWEPDPYLVVRADGTLTWILDAYTVTGRIPYSAPVRDLGNYIRNPVKATVDAYDGRVRLWAVEPDEPLLRCLDRVFPATFAPLDSMPEDLRTHMRYPDGLFSVQAQVYATYHMTDPQVFYNKEDLWRVALREGGQQRRNESVAPYFTVMKLAGVGTQEEFILMLPFTPARKENMVAWMCARCDPPNYGKLLVYTFPKERLVYGPRQIESRINQDTEIAKELTLWNQQGSNVIRGNLLVVPVDSSIVYFQPLYLRADSDAGLPELKRILVAFRGRIAMEPTMDRALASVFGPGAGGGPDVATTPGPGSAPPGSVVGAALGDGTSPAERLRRASEIYRRAQEALRRGDLRAYAREMESLGQVLGESGDR